LFMPCACGRLQQYLQVTHGRGVFVHIPKTGGTSIENAFGLRGSCHSSVIAMRGCNSTAFDSAVTFATIRHPLDRAVSLYEYTRHGGDGSPRDRNKWRWVAQLNSFPNFVERLATNRTVLQRDGHFLPQSHFIVSTQAKLQVDVLLCLEGMADGLRMLMTREPRLAQAMAPLRHLRVRRHSVDAFSLRLIRQLERIYADDFRLWYTHCIDYAKNESRAAGTPGEHVGMHVDPH
jgi:hypothetical protein